MLRTLRLLWLFVASALWRLPCASAQNVPPIACPNYFQYLSYDNQFIGRLTLYNLPMGTARVEVMFSQREPVRTNYYGRLSLFYDQDTTIKNLQNGDPVSYRVDFPISNVLPKLTNIRVNGVDICSASDYPAPSTMLNLEHTLHSSVTHVRNSRPGGFIDRNPFPEPSLSGSNFPTFNIPTPTQQSPERFPERYPEQRPTPRRTTTTTTTTQRPISPIPSTPNRLESVLTTEDINAQCGREGGGPVITNFVHFGKVLTRGQFPWLTAIYRKQSSGISFLCGGSLISTRTVVTAAHCFRFGNVLTADQIVVQLGRYDFNNYDEQFELRGLQKLIRHPDYNGQVPDADVAILHLVTPVSFTNYIQPICLWNEPTNLDIIVGEKGIVAGWGADENGNSISPLPKMVDANIVTETDCLKSLEAFKNLTSPRTICAGNRDSTGPCQGDSGGGLMLKRNGRWVLRGIVSVGVYEKQACNLREYVVYCDLAKHLQFVQDNILS